MAKKYRLNKIVEAVTREYPEQARHRIMGFKLVASPAGRGGVSAILRAGGLAVCGGGTGGWEEDLRGCELGGREYIE